MQTNTSQYYMRLHTLYNGGYLLAEGSSNQVTTSLEQPRVLEQQWSASRHFALSSGNAPSSSSINENFECATPYSSHFSPCQSYAITTDLLRPANFVKKAIVSHVDILHNIIYTREMTSSSSHKWTVPNLSDACAQHVIAVGYQVLIEANRFQITIKRIDEVTNTNLATSNYWA